MQKLIEFLLDKFVLLYLYEVFYQGDCNHAKKNCNSLKKKITGIGITENNQVFYIAFQR